MSKTIANLIRNFAGLATSLQKPKRRAMTLALASEKLAQVHRVATERGDLLFACPTARALHDPLNFFTGEPETLGWIDTHVKEGEVFWDIGANIGVYALYAALRPDVSVLAFEPGAASFAALVRNLELNGAGEKVQAYCLAFDETTRLDRLHMMNTGAGHSTHAFGRSETVFGAFEPAFSQAVPGFAIDDFRRIFALGQPDHVKLDVDGNEARILNGGRETLEGVRTVLVEVEGGERESGGPAAVLGALGFRAAPESGDGARNRLFVNPRFDAGA